jgi:ATP-dependent DNA helicase RecG
MSDDPLQTPLRYVRGVGPARAKLLAKLGLETVGDLLCYLPRDILDLTEVRPVAELNDEQIQTVRGVVADVDQRRLSAGRTLAAVLLDCDGEYVRGVWFNQNWILQKFRPGDALLFSAKPKRRSGRWEFPHPRVQPIDEFEPGVHGGIVPVYGLTEGLKMHVLRNVLETALEQYVSSVPEHLPDEFRGTWRLPRLGRALEQLHRPIDRKTYEAARHRLIFDDLLEFQLGLALRRRARAKWQQAPGLPTTTKIDHRIRRLFPFTFTAGQDQAVREITADLATRRAMHRLLQADVGAGKTAVAVYTMLVALAAGYQTVLMAPTEVLASQHWDTLNEALAHSRVKRLLLTGQLTKSRRQESLSRIKTGDVELIVGTHAVIQEDVEFHKLGLAIVDEQHKFGVVQRAHFSTGEFSPHVLVMTATPIPRSLCLTQFGDLDITTIRELPPGRQPVHTSRVSGPHEQERSWEFVRQQLSAGRQAYVICPRIEVDTTDDVGWAEEDAKMTAGSAEQVYRQLSSGELAGFRVGLVHGQLDQRRRSEVMESFRAGALQALVSTTVVEVGVDVPNATQMVVIQAERFGLSQLHQLRGRISRGKFQGYCFLFSDAASPDADRRLEALVATSDGFEIAEIDFDLRGPGDVLGTRQHGDLPLKLADLVRDREVLEQARGAAFALVDSGEIDSPQFAPLKIRVLDRFGSLMELPRSG